MPANAVSRKTRTRASRGACASAASATSAYTAADTTEDTASNAVAEGGCRSESIARTFSQIMSRMFRAALGLIVFVLVVPSLSAQRAVSLTPDALAQIWDTEHVSPPLPPLLEHDEVERRLQAVAQTDPSRTFFERVG